jgi:serine/threonine protein kinase
MTIGNYVITRKLSRGGMGTVYCAEHVLIGKAAAIKVLHPEFSGNKDIINRFFNEAKATTSIRHPGIVEVFDYGYLPSGNAYLIMEFLEGMSLGRRLRKGGRFEESIAAVLMRSVCNALAAAHDKNIVHRDLKPDNLFLIKDPESALGERLKVLDFGIAKLTDLGLDTMQTKTGAVMGTPTYMSPEQCRGKGEVDHRADLYSIGCILYELICGRPPFTDLGAGELIGAHLHLVPDPPSKYEPKVTPEMEALILSLLEKRPELRQPQTMPELARSLGRIAAQLGQHLSQPVMAQALPPLPDDYAHSLTELAPEIIVTPTRPPAVAGANEEKPTTLSRAASEIAAAPTRRAARIGGIALALVGLGVAGMVAFTRWSADAADPTSTAPTASAATAASAPPVAVAPVVAPPATPAPETPAPETPVPATPATPVPAAHEAAVAAAPPAVPATARPKPPVTKPSARAVVPRAVAAPPPKRNANPTPPPAQPGPKPPGPVVNDL